MSGRQQAKAAKSQAAANAIAGGGFKEANPYDPWGMTAQLASGAGDIMKIQDDIALKKKKLEAIERRRNGGTSYGDE